MPKRVPPTPFRRPEEMHLRLNKPRSIRFTNHTETTLEREAHKAEIGFSTLINQICSDYVKWLERNGATD